jgi:hypothetical protein
MEKGSTRGTVTDLNGHFSFKGQPGATLAISYIGYTTLEKKGAQDMHITLQEDQKSLSEVVVIGYGVQKKSVVTASLTRVHPASMPSTLMILRALRC